MSQTLLAFVDDVYEDLEAIWVDEPVVVDANLLSSRTLRELAPFARAMVEFLQASVHV
jgi:putative intracellular protease/amidase